MPFLSVAKTYPLSPIEIPVEVKVDLHTKDENYEVVGGDLLWEREVDGIKILTCKVDVPPNEQVEVKVVEIVPIPEPLPLTLYLAILVPIVAVVLLVYYLLKVLKVRKGKIQEKNKED